MLAIKARTRRIKFWLHLISAYAARYKYPFAASLLSFVVAIYLGSILWPKISRSNIVTIGYVGNYTIETVPAEVLSLATQSLIKTDETGKPVPSLASHWTTSEDGQTYVIFLKDNLAWHDGTQVDAKDITIAIENVSITALNNKAIEFRLQSPIASFPTALDKPVFKSRSFYGTGEFRITQIDQSEDTIKQIQMTPKNKDLPRVEIKFYQTEEQLQNAIKLGNVKYASVKNAQLFQTWPNLEVKRGVEDSEVVTVFFNTEDPLLSSKDLRQALAHTIERSSFDGEPAFSVLSPRSWAYNPDVKRYEYNTGKAKELVSKSQVQNPKIVLTVVGNFSHVAESIKQDWHELGIEVEIKTENAIPKDFQALLAANEIPQDPDQYGLWHSTQIATNLTKYKDVKIDKLLEDARATQNQDDRKTLYFDFQRFLMEDLPAAPLYHPYKYEVVYKNAKTSLEKLPIEK